MSNIKHIEVEGCVINVRTGLRTSEGELVTSIEIIPDGGWRLNGYINNRVIKNTKGDD